VETCPRLSRRLKSQDLAPEASSKVAISSGFKERVDINYNFGRGHEQSLGIILAGVYSGFRKNRGK